MKRGKSVLDKGQYGGQILDENASFLIRNNARAAIAMVARKHHWKRDENTLCNTLWTRTEIWRLTIIGSTICRTRTRIRNIAIESMNRGWTLCNAIRLAKRNTLGCIMAIKRRINRGEPRRSCATISHRLLRDWTFRVSSIGIAFHNDKSRKMENRSWRTCCYFLCCWIFCPAQ